MKNAVFSVSSLTRYIKQVFDNDLNLQSILIKGEISNFTNHRSGHWYFTLKDAKSKISCVMFASYASKCQILLKEGMQVIVSASVSMYEPHGSCQLFVTKVQIDGLGDLYLQYEQLKQTLQKEGLFAKEHKKPLPLYPLDIAIVSAKEGAALQDMLTTIARRWPLANVQIYPSLVQGIHASKCIIETLQQVESNHHEVVLLARGGGAIEDLWCFNDEALARFIYQMETVIVTGVGHETDTTLVDYVSDARAPTPTAAAELITPDIYEVLEYQNRLKAQLIRNIKTILQRHQVTLQPLCSHRFFKNPLLYVQQERLRLAMQSKSLFQMETMHHQKKYQLQKYAHQLSHIAKVHIEEDRQKLQQLFMDMNLKMEQIKMHAKHTMKEHVALLDAYSPLKILHRGYSIAYKDKKIIASIHDVEQEDEIRIRLHDGAIRATIKEKEELSYGKEDTI